MSNKTRKRIWPVGLVTAVAVVGMLAAFLVLTVSPATTDAHGGRPNDSTHCDDITSGSFGKAGHDSLWRANPEGAHTCDNPSGAPNPTTVEEVEEEDDVTGPATLKSSSKTGSAAVKLTLTIELDKNLTGSSWVEIYLEDDYQEPGSIAKENVVFEARDRLTTGGSGVDVDTTFAAAAVEIDDGGTIVNPDGDDDEDVVVISARIPDMKDGDATGYPKAGQTLIMVVSDAAGIKNPSEAGSHSVGYSIIGGTDDRADEAEMKLTDLTTVAKISLSDDDGGRGKEVTISGSGFNNGTTAEAFVLPVDSDMDGEVSKAELWNALDCYEMNQAVGQMGEAMDTEGNGFCRMYADLSAGNKTTVDNLVYTTGYPAAALCSAIVRSGDSLGTVNVGSDDKFAIVFTVHQDEFDAGNVNYICAEDAEAGNPRQASAVKMFDLTASISLDLAEANSGDEVTLKARDFGGLLTEISLGPDKTWTMVPTDTDAFKVERDGDDYTFDVPGGLSGVIQVAAKRGSTRKTADLTITPSSLTLNQTEVVPNESIIISGSGFSERAEILTSMILIDGKMLEVDDAGTDGSGADRHVDITSSGQFTVTVNVWHDGADNPALDADEYTIKVTDSKGYEGKTKITISEPTVMVTPEVAGPRDFITISGTNWPVTTSEDDYDVSIGVDGKTRSASIDRSGRFNYQYRLSGSIGIGKEHDVKVTFTSVHGDEVEEETTFSVPSSNVVITPPAAAPGQTIDLEISGMPIGELVSKVTIDGGNRLGGINLNTDRNGDVTITGIVVPYSEPGFYPVKIEVGGMGGEISIVQLEILAESDVRGVASPLPESVMDLGDSVVRIFHFNTSSKVWTFYDPRPEFEGLNTLTELAAGQPYSILVSENVEDVVLNGKIRNLTCVGGDCWNQLVW